MIDVASLDNSNTRLGMYKRARQRVRALDATTLERWSATLLAMSRDELTTLAGDAATADTLQESGAGAVDLRSEICAWIATGTLMEIERENLAHGLAARAWAYEATRRVAQGEAPAVLVAAIESRTTSHWDINTCAFASDDERQAIGGAIRDEVLQRVRTAPAKDLVESAILAEDVLALAPDADDVHWYHYYGCISRAGGVRLALSIATMLDYVYAADRGFFQTKIAVDTNPLIFDAWLQSHDEDDALLLALLGHVEPRVSACALRYLDHHLAEMDTRWFAPANDVWGALRLGGQA